MCSIHQHIWSSFGAICIDCPVANCSRVRACKMMHVCGQYSSPRHAMGRLSEHIIMCVVFMYSNMGGNVRGCYNDASIGVGNSGGGNGQAQAASVSSAPGPHVVGMIVSGIPNVFINIEETGIIINQLLQSFPHKFLLYLHSAQIR